MGTKGFSRRVRVRDSIGRERGVGRGMKDTISPSTIGCSILYVCVCGVCDEISIII